MSDFVSIEEFNKHTIINRVTFDLDEYFTKIHVMFYSKYEIDFMKFFLSICEKENQFCIEQAKLIEYGVITNSHLSHIIVCLGDRGLQENIDYQIVKVKRKVIRLKEHSEVLLTPRAFKICLARSIKTDKYMNYFLLLEVIYKYYTSYQLETKNYQLELKNKEIVFKDDKIEFLIKKLDENKIEFKKEFKTLNTEFKRVNTKLDNLTNIAYEVSGRSVPSTQKKGSDHAYSLLQRSDHNEDDDQIEFMLIRGTENYVKTKEKKFKEVYTTKMTNYSPNSINFGIRLKRQVIRLNALIMKQLKNEIEDKEELEEYKKFFIIECQNNKYYVGNQFGVNNFIELIKLVDDEKYDEITKLQY